MNHSVLPLTTFGLAAAGLLTLVKIRSKNALLPPKAAKRPHTVYFGKVEGENRGPNPITPAIEHNDPYFWLRDDTRSNPEVLNHLKKENLYAARVMAHTVDFCDKLFLELKSHVKETDQEVPYKHGEYYYYSREVEGLSYKIRCRKASIDGKEEILLDENKLASGKPHCAVGAFVPSPDHTHILYAADFTGNEVYNLYSMNVSTGKVTLEVEDASTSCAWGKDTKSFYYIVLDDNHRPYKMCRHIIGQKQDKDEILFEESDELFWLGMGKSSSGDYIILESASSETEENHYISLKEDERLLKCFAPRVKGIRYGDIDHNGDYFYFRTNKDAKNFCLMKAPINKTTVENWAPVFPYQESVFIEGVQTFKNYVVINGREEGYSQVWVLDLKTNDKHRIEAPERAHDIGVGKNKVFDTEVLRIVYESLTTPQVVYDYDMRTHTLTVLKKKEVPGYNPEFYGSKTLYAPASDGTLIPMSLVYRKDLREDEKGNLTKGPALLYGYGSYGLSMDPDFRITRLPLLDRGLIYVIAHIRGGGDMGYTWYQDQGKYLTKLNTFNDFIACGNHLVGQEITDNSQLAINGRSAGGLLMGAVVNMRPDMAAAVVTGVPFVDVMTTMCDPSIPLTITEWEEWGNPNEHKYYSYMKQYSPIDNVRPQHYPAILITGGLHDPRVAYWEPVKYAATLREKTQSDNPIICKIDMEHGHFSASDRYQYLRETAFDLSFILDRLKLNNTLPKPYPK